MIQLQILKKYPITKFITPKMDLTKDNRSYIAVDIEIINNVLPNDAIGNEFIFLINGVTT